MKKNHPQRWLTSEMLNKLDPDRHLSMKEVYLMKSWKSIDISHVTSEDVGNVWKVFVGKEEFYRANSATDPFKAYTVAWHRDHHAFTCTCAAGLVGFSNCW
jgi:hypothetical protein